MKDIITLKTSKADGSYSEVSVVVCGRSFTTFIAKADQRLSTRSQL